MLNLFKDYKTKAMQLSESSHPVTSSALKQLDNWLNLTRIKLNQMVTATVVSKIKK
jgi:hypothetical protein